MTRDYRANYMPLTLQFDFRTAKKIKVRLIVKDKFKPNTFFCNRFKTIYGSETIDVRMPQTSQILSVVIFNEVTKDSEGIRVHWHPKHLDIKLDSFDYKNRDIQEFIEFAQNFSYQAGYSTESAVVGGSRGQFAIRYDNVLYDKEGHPVNTPARIGADTGVMEVSRTKFRDYTIPMRMIILLHEFSHFWRNSDKHDEEEADMHALNIYLGLGYPKHEALVAFATVFLGADTPMNRERYKKIEKYVTEFNHNAYVTI